MASAAGRYALLLLCALLALGLRRLGATSAGANAGVRARLRRGSGNGRNDSGSGSGSGSATGHIVVYSTTPTAAAATAISAALVQRRLAACVQTVPGVSSTYWWAGKVNVDQEHLLLIKARAANYPGIATAITELHPYDTPEIVAHAVAHGSDKYLDWIDETTKSPTAGGSAGTE